jgi:RNA polymerase sigma factor (sigma-70 family)
MAETRAEARKRRAVWVSLRVLPHEPRARAWLRRMRVAETDADEVIQDAYCRLATLEAVDHIENPGAYFFSVIRSLLARRLRSAKVVPLESIAEIEAADPAPDPEHQAAASQMSERLHLLIDKLPERCARILKLRKLQGYSQREIAEMLGISESIVENQVQLGVRNLTRAWSRAAAEASDRLISFERSGEAL